ncbi:MAG: fibronectin type III domain-containing protein [Chitinophagales bacterium]
MKKTFLFLMVFAFSIHSYALTSITTKKVLDGPFCGGAALTVGYDIDASAITGNVFTAQLSDKDGNFASPTTIGSVTKKNSGNISCTLPAGLVTSKKYKIRVISSTPAVIGSPCANNVSINPKPNELSASGITACEITLNWASVSTAASYKVQYRVAGTTDWSSSIDAALANSYTFSGLASSTTYDLQVRAICENGEKSDWSKVTKTTSACPIPTSFIVTDIGLTTSSLNWNDALCSTGYLFQYRAFGEPDWIPLTTSTSNINLTGLSAATLYEAQVANDCGITNSAYTASIIWETQYFKVAGSAEMEASFKVFPNPSTGTFVVRYNNQTANEPVEINVQNMYGQVVFSAERQSTEGVNEEKIELRNATAGLYFVSIRSEGKEFKTSLMIK